MIRRLLIGTGVATLVAFAGVAAPLAAELPAGGTVAAVENTKGPLKIVFEAFQNNPFWIPVTAGEKAAAEYLKGFNAQVDYVDLGDTLSAEKVIAGIESAVAQKYNGVVIVPIFDGTERAIDEAADSGVPVINIIAEGSVPSKRIAFIGQDATAAGARLGEYIAKKLDCKGKVGVITGYFGAVQHTQRMNGAIDYLKAHCPQIKILGPFENQDKAEKAYSIVQDMYTANPDLALVYVTAGGPFGAAKAIKDLGLTGKVGVVGFDHTPDNTAYIKSGEMYALLDQAPFQQAFDATVMMYNYLVTGKPPAESRIKVKGKILTKDGLQD